MAQAAKEVAPDPARSPDRENGGDATQAYDFRTGSELSREALSQLRMNAERMSVALGRIINAYLDSPARFEIKATRGDKLNQYIADLPRHSAMALVRISSKAPQMIWSVTPELIGAIVGRMLGGPPETIDRPATLLEAALLKRFMQEMVEIWATTWDGLARYGPEVTELAAQTAQLEGKVREGEAVVVEIAAEISGVASSMHLAIPVAAAQWMLGDNEPREESRAIDRGRLRQTGERIIVPVSLVLHRMQIQLSEAARLEPGDVLPLGKPSGDPVTIAVRGRPKFEASAGVADGRLAAKILGPANERWA